jgi:hypothetical protein
MQPVKKKIRDIPNAINISDDIIIFGQTQADHDEALRAVFSNCFSNGFPKFS